MGLADFASPFVLTLERTLAAPPADGYDIPAYSASGNERALFEKAWEKRLPLLLSEAEAIARLTAHAKDALQFGILGVRTHQHERVARCHPVVKGSSLIFRVRKLVWIDEEQVGIWGQAKLQAADAAHVIAHILQPEIQGAQSGGGGRVEIKRNWLCRAAAQSADDQQQAPKQNQAKQRPIAAVEDAGKAAAARRRRTANRRCGGHGRPSTPACSFPACRALSCWAIVSNSSIDCAYAA